jgi:bZIP transcription factor
MAAAVEPLTPSNHLPLEPTGLTPGFGGTPGFFSAEFGALNPFDADFHDATASPLRVEQSLGTPPSHYATYPSENVPRSVSDHVLRRSYDPSLVPTPGPRIPILASYKPSALKESTTADSASRTFPPSPQRSPIALNAGPNALNPAFLVDSNQNFSGLNNSRFTLPPPAHSGYGSSRGVHGEVTPPTDESRSPDDKDMKSKSSRTKSPKKRKAEIEAEAKSEREAWSSNDDESMMSGQNDSGPQDHKRKKFLERNRLAASKCRQKKKEWANNLEEQARYQAQENKLLRASVSQLRDECLYLKNFVLTTHQGCSCVGVKKYLMNEAQMSQQVAGMGGGMPIASLVHPGMDPRGYPMMGMHGLDNRGRSMSVGSGITMSDGRPQGSMSPS